MWKYIRDKNGTKYAVHEVNRQEDLIWWEVRRGKDFVGHIKGTMKSNYAIEINEIEIRNDLESADTKAGALECLIMESRSENNGKNYRGKGLGKRLITLFIEYARERGVKQLFGSLIQTDIVRNRGLGLDLIEWYKKLGFREGPTYQGCIEEAKTWMYLDLEPVENLNKS